MWICIAPCCEHTSKVLRYGTRSQGISQFYLHTPHTSTNGMNHTCLYLPSQKLVLIYRPRRDGRLSWPWVAGWLNTEISVRHRELNPDMVAHLSTNRAWRRLTSLIEANALNTTPDHHHTNIPWDTQSNSLCWTLLIQKTSLILHILIIKVLGYSKCDKHPRNSNDSCKKIPDENTETLLRQWCHIRDD